MSSIANQTNEINTGEYTQHSITVSANTATKIYEATNDCEIILTADNTGVKYKINGTSSSSNYDFVANETDSTGVVLINDVSVFSKNINHIAGRKLNPYNSTPYIKMDLSKGDYISLYSLNSISITYYVRSN